METENKKQLKLWFRAKDYGWGWTPVSWEGWLLIIFYVLYLVYFASIIPSNPTLSETIFYVLGRVVVPTVILITVCYARGEKPEWRWGGKPINEKNADNQK